MKFSPLILLAAMLACQGSATAQNDRPGAQELQPRAQETSVLHDGIVVQRGQTYLIRYGRAALVDAALVTEGKVLTLEGMLVTLPKDYAHDTNPTLKGGLFANGEQMYLARGGRVVRVDAALVPEGKVLTAEGQLLPLPSNFSGFVRVIAPDGSVLPTPPPQSLPGQAGVTRAPVLAPEVRDRRPVRPGAGAPRAVGVVTPMPEEVLVALPVPMNLLPAAGEVPMNLLLPANAPATVIVLPADAETPKILVPATGETTILVPAVPVTKTP